MGNVAAIYLLHHSGKFNGLFGESLLAEGIDRIVGGVEDAVEKAKKKREENKLL